MAEIILLKHNNKICGFYNSKDEVENFINSCLSCGFIKITDKIQFEYYKINSFIKIKTIVYKIPKVNVNKSTNYEEFSSSDESSIDTSTNSNIKSNNSNIKSNNSNIKSNNSNIKSNNIENNSDTESSVDPDDFLKKIRENRLQQNKVDELLQTKTDIITNINKLKLEKKKIEEQHVKYNYDLSLFEKFKNLQENNNNFIIPEMFKNKFNIFLKLENENNLSFESFLENYHEEKMITLYEELFESGPYTSNNNNEEFKSNNISDLIEASI